MSNREKYKPVMFDVAAAREWPLMELFTEREPVEALVGFVRTAAGHHDDDGAVRYLPWLRSACRDRHLYPLLDDEGCLPWSDKIDPAKDEAEREYALLLMEKIWPKLPLSKKVQNRYQVAEDEGEWRAEDGLTLPKTKAFIVDALLARWRNTRDNLEASALMKFLLDGCWAQAKFPEERKAIVAAFREKTDSAAKLDRLADALVMLHGQRAAYVSSTDTEEMHRVLAIAWARNRSSYGFMSDLRIVQPFVVEKEGTVLAALNLLKSLAADLSALNAKVMRFLESCAPIFHKGVVSYDIAYPAVGCLELTCHLGGFKIPAGGPVDRAEDWCYERYAEIRDQVDAWKASPEGSGVKILLKADMHGLSWKREVTIGG